jgi:hypothetical protein
MTKGIITSSCRGERYVRSLRTLLTIVDVTLLFSSFIFLLPEPALVNSKRDSATDALESGVGEP